MSFESKKPMPKLKSRQCACFSLDITNFRNVNEQISSDLKLSSCKYKWEFMIRFEPSYFQIGLKRTDTSTHPIQIILSIKVEYIQSRGARHGRGVSTDQSDVYQEYNLGLMENQNEIFCNRMQQNILYNNMLEGTISLSCGCQSSLTQESMVDKNVIQLQNDIHLLLEKAELSDVILKVGNSHIPAHKLILSSRSPVFRKMFENNMKENKSGYVEIEDTKEHVIKIFLAFLYHGTLKDTKYETVYVLYITADKYDVPTLLDTCRNHLNSFISLATVLKILQLADLHHDKSLKTNCSNFICENFEEIELKDEWNTILDKNPRLASYVLRNLSSKFRNLKK